MRNVEPDARRSVAHQRRDLALDDPQIGEDRPLVSVVIPAYNEADILVPNLTRFGLISTACRRCSVGRWWS